MTTAETAASGLPAIPRRAYYTAMQLGLAGIVMFFMALTSSFLVRKALGTDWVAIALPPVLWFNSRGAAGEQRHDPVGQQPFGKGRRARASATGGA